MKDRDEFREEYRESFYNKNDLPLTMGESLMLSAAWGTAWNLATAKANGIEMTLEEAYPKNHVDTGRSNP